MKYHSKLNLFFFLVMAFLMPSCQDDNTAHQPAETGGGLYISLDTSAATRTDPEPDPEEAINSLYAIYFVDKVGDGSAYNYYGCASCTWVSESKYRMTGYPTIASYPGETTDDYRMKVMFVANAAELFDLVPTAWTGDSFPNVEDGLIVTKATKTGIWGQKTEMEATGLPMYVCSGAVEILAETLTNDETLQALDEDFLSTQSKYSLVRMLAKFTINNNITLTADAASAGRASFALTKVQLIRGYDQGYLSNGKTDEYPPAATQSTVENAYSMVNPDTITITGTDVEQIIFYAFPAKNEKKDSGDLTNHTENCYIRLEGKVGAAQESTAYMLPIAGTVESGLITTPGDIERNTHYIYRIDGVTEQSLVVQAWIEEKFNAEVNGVYRTLNVSATKATVTATSSTTRIYFWSNQATVSVDEKGRISTDGDDWTGGEYNVSDVFEELGSGGTNVVYDAGQGYIVIALSSTHTLNTAGTYYRSIFINAGGLRSEIKIKIIVED